MASPPVFAHTAPWLDTRIALDALPTEVLNGTQRAHAVNALGLWMLLAPRRSSCG